MPTVLKSGNLKLLEHPGPVQAFNGIAFYSEIEVRLNRRHICPSTLSTICSNFEQHLQFLKLHSFSDVETAGSPIQEQKAIRT